MVRILLEVHGVVVRGADDLGIYGGVDGGGGVVVHLLEHGVIVGMLRVGVGMVEVVRVGRGSG